MKFEMSPVLTPPPLEFGSGEDAFKLHLRAATTVDRAAVLDALAAGSFADVQRAVESLIVGWTGVFDENGNPIHWESADMDGRRVRNFPRLMGRAPLALQFEITAAILAFLGMPRGSVESIAGAAQAGRPNMDPTSAPASSGPATASGA